jgi:hypothetical protein
MKKIVLIIVFLIPLFSISQKYNFKVTSKIMGKDVIELNSDIIIDVEKKEITYSTAGDMYVGSITYTLSIDGYSYNGDLLIANFNIDNPMYSGSPGKFQANLKNNRLQFIDWSIEGVGRSAVYTFDFNEIYEEGDDLLISGEYEIETSNPWARGLGFTEGKILDFYSKNYVFIPNLNNGKNTSFYFKKVVTNSEISKGIYTNANGIKMGTFTLTKNLFSFTVLDKITEFNIKLTKSQLEKNRIITDNKNKLLELKNLINLKLQSKEYVEAARLYESNNINDQYIFQEIQKGIKSFYVEQTPNEEEIIKLITTKYNLDSLINLSSGQYKLISNLNEGLFLVNNSNDKKINLDKNAYSIIVGQFERINQFEKQIDINITKNLIGIVLNSQWKGNLSNSNITMRFFKAQKKGKTIMLGGAKDTPPNKYTIIERVPFINNLSNVFYNEEYELKKGRFIYMKKLMINGKEFDSIDPSIAVELDLEFYNLDWFWF